MKFPGYWVSVESGRAYFVRTVFDETDLDPATDWKQAWQNQDDEASPQGFVDLSTALTWAARKLASASGRSLQPSEADQVCRFEPVWTDDRCEIPSLSHLLDPSQGK